MRSPSEGIRPIFANLQPRADALCLYPQLSDIPPFNVGVRPIKSHSDRASGKPIDSLEEFCSSKSFWTCHCYNFDETPEGGFAAIE
jgi:hypothetical protein